MAASIWFTVVALIGLAAAWYLIKEHDPKTLTGRASVIDGDTIKIHGKRVRFNGIDAPESDYLCKDEKGEEYRQCGRYSADFLAKFLSESSPTRCEISGRDQYDRLLGDCFRADDQNVAAALVRAGYAMDWPRYSGGAYASEQEEAKTNKLGLWAGQFEPPWEYRARQRTQETSEIAPLIGNTSAQGCRIKGNISSKGERIYHVPGQKYYSATKISAGKTERWFCSEADARDAGWRRARI